jgi:hypothetical protein
MIPKWTLTIEGNITFYVSIGHIKKHLKAFNVFEKPYSGYKSIQSKKRDLQIELEVEEFQWCTTCMELPVIAPICRILSS